MTEPEFTKELNLDNLITGYANSEKHSECEVTEVTLNMVGDTIMSCTLKTDNLSSEIHESISNALKILKDSKFDESSLHQM